MALPETEIIPKTALDRLQALRNPHEHALCAQDSHAPGIGKRSATIDKALTTPRL